MAFRWPRRNNHACMQLPYVVLVVCFPYLVVSFLVNRIMQTGSLQIRHQTIAAFRLTAHKTQRGSDTETAALTADGKETENVLDMIEGLEVLTESERALYSDEADLTIVNKRDTDSTHPIRVAMLEFDIPTKVPKPRNFLENAVWQRENDIDRLRESYTLPRAISIAKSAELKYPRRNLVKAILDYQQAEHMKPLVIVELMRHGVHRGAYCSADSPTHTADWQQYLASAAAQLTPTVNSGGITQHDTFRNRIVGLGTNVEGNLYHGSYEDLAIINRATTLPMIYNDLVTSVFQLLQAKIHGAHAVKLLACVLETKELNYLTKVARTLGLCTIIVVASKPQLLRVLAEVDDLQAVSVTSRNMRLWKIDVGKADRILQDDEVQTALATRRSLHSTSSATQPDGANAFVLLQEGFASPSELHRVAQHEVDAVILGEELIPYEDNDIVSTIGQWVDM